MLRLKALRTPYPRERMRWLFEINGIIEPQRYKVKKRYTPEIKKANIIEVIISRPLALFNTCPAKAPSKMEIGVETIIAKKSP